MSSPEYVELRGISGNAVTAKAALMGHPAKRSLLFFLQAMSLKPGGLQKFCRDFLAMFESRIGTPAMHRAGIKPGATYRLDVAAEIEREFDEWAAHSPQRTEQHRSVDFLLAKCREKLSNLSGFIIDLCINPKLQFSAPGETNDSIQLERVVLDHVLSEPVSREAHSFGLSKASDSPLPYFQDLIGALFEFKVKYEEAARRDFVMTEVGKQTFEVLDVALQTGKMVVIEGEAGIGKTTATEAWCNLHLGEARFVSISGISHKTGVFRAIAKVLGMASSYARTATEMQARIEDMLQRSQLVLVIDEAHHLFSAAERVYSRPELVDWINTALYNHHVPCGLVCTPQFAIRMARVEKQTAWNADQLRRRVKRFCTLPAKPRSQDLEAVARKLLPGASEATIKYIYGHALASKLHMPALVDAIDEAKLLVQREGRDTITFEDAERAIRDYCAPSALAMSRSFSAQLDPKKPGRRAMPVETAFNEPLSPVERPGKPAPDLGRKTNLTGLAPVAAPMTTRRDRHVLDSEPLEA